MAPPWRALALALLMLALAGATAADRALAAPARRRADARIARRGPLPPPSGRPTTSSSPALDDLMAGYTRQPGSPPDDDAAIVSWTPPSPWFDTAPIVNASYPTCQHEDWCDAPYADTAAFQAALHAHQNPPDCASARHLVLAGEWTSGLGSTLHIHAYMLSLAASDNRVLTLAPDQGWEYAPSSACGCADVGRPCGDTASSTVTNKDCWFVPASRCAPPAGWQTAPEFALGRPDVAIMRAHSVSELFGVSQCELSVQAGPGSPLAAWRERPPSWWQAQLIKYITRPRPSMIQRIILPAYMNAFWETGGVPPRPLASVFMRAGDKGSEAALLPVQTYMDELDPIATKLNIRHVYLSSDDRAMIDAAVDAHGSRYKFHFLDMHRQPGGASFSQVMSWAGMWRMEHLVRLALGDAFITAAADAQIGTLSSNWCRLTDHLRRAAGRARVPYGSPEKRLYYAVCPNVEADADQHAKHLVDWPVQSGALRIAVAPSWAQAGVAAAGGPLPAGARGREGLNNAAAGL